MKTRYFNTLDVNKSNGTIMKTSRDHKILDEINFIQSLPKDVSILFPRILDVGKDNYLMEYYAYPTIAQSMICRESFDWNLAFERISETLALFKQYQSEISKKQHEAFYFDKFLSRITQFYDQFPGINQDLCINGKLALGVDKLLDRIASGFDSLYHVNDHCIMHGDFFFGNILFDQHQGIIRLIDPRGSFGDHVGIYGDQKYDLAKLMHSIIGGYDYIINEQFKITILSDTNIDYEIKKSPLKLASLFKSINDYDYDKLMFIMGTLFISMVPLHSDDPVRQKLLYVHGLHILNKVL